jgi:hypothetical protein
MLKNNSQLSIFNYQLQKEYLNAISDKMTQYFKKYSCVFDTNVLVIDSTSKLSSFAMQKI